MPTKYIILINYKFVYRKMANMLAYPVKLEVKLNLHV